MECTIKALQKARGESAIVTLRVIIHFYDTQGSRQSSLMQGPMMLESIQSKIQGDMALTQDA